MALSKTQQALALMEEKNMTAYQAAKALGLNNRTVYRAWQVQAAKGPRLFCPCCGFEVPHAHRMRKGEKAVPKSELGK